MRLLLQKSYFWTLSIIVVFFYACATITALPGGEIDETPPQVNMEKSTPNFQTNFSGKEFEIFFDEWIQIKDKSQILISPPLKYNPEITYKGKALYIEFNEEEVLKPKTTYVIQLSKSIKDFTEGNVITGYNHVFSTGDFIDSLSISGEIYDAFSRQPSEGVSVMLYETMRDTLVIGDSIIYQERPYYLSLSDERGKFQINNIKYGTYRLVAIEDNNLNNMFDPISEKIGYLDTLITIDSAMYFSLSMFREIPKLQFIDIEHEENGIFSLIFNTAIREETNLGFSESIEFRNWVIEDSIMRVSYVPDSTLNLSMYIMEDTIKIKYLNENRTFFDYEIINEKNVHPKEKLEIELDTWIASIDTSYISIRDTGEVNISYSVDRDSLSPTKLFIDAPWKEGEKYQLVLLPNAIKGIDNVVNDSIEATIKIASMDDYGTINFSLAGMDSSYSYLIHLKQKEKILKTIQLKSDSSSSKHVFDRLLEGSYEWEIIEDKNKDGIWTPGNYLGKTQSERYDKTGSAELRKNWDLDFEYLFGTAPTIEVPDTIKDAPSTTKDEIRPNARKKQ